MAEINMNSIAEKVRKFSQTPAGKEKMKKAVEKLANSNKAQTALGQELLSRSRMVELTEELIGVIKSTAASYDLPPSVMKHFDSLDYIIQAGDDGNVESLIYFADDSSRESLDADIYTGDGIDNIIALFNNGYVASSYAYGWWDGHTPTPGNIISTSGSVYVRSKIGRPSLRFMQRAIEDFASRYTGKYPMVVELNDSEYDGNFAGSLNGVITKK